jgi:hypothetical protein
MGGRWLVGLAILVLPLTACSAASVPGVAPCSLTEVPSTSVVKDILSGVTPLGSGVVSAGTRFAGANGVAITATMSGGSWVTSTIKGYPYTSEELEDVAVLDPGSAWAVGTVGSDRPAIVRWDGTTWANVTATDPGPEEDGLSGVTIVSDHLGWAVGRHQVGLWFDTLVERWDGSAWRTVPSPNQGSRSSMLHDVAADAPDDAWAVGWSLVGHAYVTLAERWNGSRWAVVPTPVLGPGDHILSGVAALGPSDVWTVGWTSNADVIKPLAEHWDGQRWSVERFASGLDGAGLSAIAPVADGLMIVGRQMVQGNPSPLAILDAGSGWTKVPIRTAQPNKGTLIAITTDRTGRVWGVGSQFSTTGLAASLVVAGCDGS